MKLHISINGHDVADYGLMPVDGNLKVLTAPRTYKAATTNENAAIHGSMLVTTPGRRKFAKKDMTLAFLMDSASLIDQQKQIAELEQVLVNGKMNGSTPTGINEVYVAELQKTYYLYYNSIDPYAYFDGTKAFLNIKFTEFNPNNRV